MQIRIFLKEDLDEILHCARAMPSWNNAQDYSVIVIKDKATKEKIANLAKGNPHIAYAPVFLIFAADFYKTDLGAKKNDADQIVQDSVHGVSVATFDAGIGLGGAIVAAESLGYGISVIGGIRGILPQLTEILDLPPLTFPIVGMCIGYPNPDHVTQKKPRFPVQGFIHKEKYNKITIQKNIDDYDVIMEKYLQEVGRYDIEKNWSYRTSFLYAMDPYPQFTEFLKAQKFNIPNK